MKLDLPGIQPAQVTSEVAKKQKQIAHKEELTHTKTLLLQVGLPDLAAEERMPKSGVHRIDRAAFAGTMRASLLMERCIFLGRLPFAGGLLLTC